MENLQQVFIAIKSVWDNLFGLQYPGIPLTFKGVILGTFAFLFSVYILKNVFGIGADVVKANRRKNEAETRNKLQLEKNKQFWEAQSQRNRDFWDSFHSQYKFTKK